jgi:hypothetical protein
VTRGRLLIGVVVVALLVGGTLWARGDGRRSFVVDAVLSEDAEAPQDYDDAWTEVAPSPIVVDALGPVLWTGEEVLVLGKHAAAYDPATDRWRRLVDLPPTLADDRAEFTVAGGDVFARVVRRGISTVYRYDVAADRWDGVRSPDVVDLHLVGTEERLLALRRCTCPDDPPSEHVLDLETLRWSALDAEVDPPVAPGPVQVVGDTLYRPVDDDDVEVLPAGSRRWGVVDTEGEPAWGWEGEVVGDLIVWANQPFAIDTPDTYPPEVHAYDTSEATWVDVPQLTEPMESGMTASDGDTLWFGNKILDGRTLTWSDGAHLPTTALGAAVTWIGDRWLAVGGRTPLGVTRRAYTWVPPSS